MARSLSLEVDSLKMILDSMVEFLKQFQWLHNFSMIQVLAEDSVISKLPEDWKSWFAANNHLELLLFPYEIIGCESLKTFLLTCKQYSIDSLLRTQCQYLSVDYILNEVLLQKSPYETASNSHETESISSGIQSQAEEWILKDVNSSWSALKMVSPKKKHEIERLAHFIHKLKMITESNKILDIGSGLGFLDLFLHWKYNYKVLGAEGSLAKVESALKLRKKYLKKQCPNVNFIPWVLENDCDTLDKSKEIIANLLNSTNCVCANKSEQESDAKESKEIILLSLHSCGDLSAIMLKLFAQNSKLSSIVMVSCCYHRMTPSVYIENLDEGASVCKVSGKFKNFPLSKNLTKIMEERLFHVNTHGLRLASEESVGYWQNRSKGCLSRDTTIIAYRSLLQNVCDRNKIKPKKRRRHCTNKSSINTFEDYVELVSNDYAFIAENSEEWTDYELLKSQLHEEYLLKEKNIVFVGLVRFLQLSLQPVLESVILIDRIIYLKEIGLTKCGIVQLFDDIFSPRNKAIFGFRDQFHQKLG